MMEPVVKDVTIGVIGGSGLYLPYYLFIYLSLFYSLHLSMILFKLIRSHLKVTDME